MKGITLWQPFAQLVVIGEKGYETRGWNTNVRGTIFIHSALKDDAGISCESVDYIIDSLRKRKIEPKDLPFGSIIGIVDIVDCIPVELIRHELKRKELAFGDYSDGRYAWKLENSILFDEPIKVKGKQGFWNYNL